MTEATLVGFCAAMGFAASGTIASFYKLVTARQADFGLPHKTIPGIALSISLSMFAGPFIVVSRVIAGVRTAEIPHVLAAAGFAVAAMWSVCAGIFYVSLMLGV